MLDAVASDQPLAALTAAQRDALTTLGAANAVGESARAAEPEFSATGIVSTGFDAAEPDAPALVNGLATAAEATASTDWTEHSAPDDRDRVDAELVGVFLEDVEILEAQQRSITANPARRMQAYSIDQGGVRARQMIERIRKAEGAGA